MQVHPSEPFPNRDMKLSIVVPCYNEDETIRCVLDMLLSQPLPMDREIIIIDDGSTIPTHTRIPDYIGLPGLRVFRFLTNHGKGSAMLAGAKKATGEYILFQDADMEYLPKDIPTMLRPVIDQGADAVYGARFLTTPEAMSIYHVTGNNILTRFTNLLFKSHLTDMETGFKLVRRRLLLSLGLTATEFEIEPEITAMLLRHGMRIIEVPIEYKFRERGYSKINIVDGIDAAFHPRDDPVGAPHAGVLVSRFQGVYQAIARAPAPPPDCAPALG